MKRSNGSGSVYKLSGNRRKPWVAVVVLGWDEDRAIRKPIGYYVTKAEAEIGVALYRALPSSEDANITLFDLYEKWKLTRAYTDLDRSTHWSYDAAFKFMREFYNFKFSSLRTANWQKVIDFAAELGRSHSTMAKIKTLIGILSEYAFAEDIVQKTYYKTIRLPREKARRQIPTFTDLEIAKLVRHDDDPIVQTILVLIYTGMRISELLEMRKAVVDIENMLVVGGVKTEAGRDRVIPLHPRIQSYVRQFYDRSSFFLIEYEKEIGSKKRGTKAVIRSPYRYEYYRDLYYSALERLAIRRLTPHKARHTFFTRLSEKCKDRKGMALVGGHTDPSFTEKVYDQPNIDRLRKVIECL